MKFILILIFSLSFTSTIAAQRMQGKIMRPSWLRNRDGIQTVDSGNIRIWYALNAEDINNPSTYIDLQRLEIGEKLSKYSSYIVSNSDSLCAAWMKEHPQAQSVPRRFGLTGRYPDFWSECQFSVYFKDYQTNQFTEYARMPFGLKKYDSQSAEVIPVQNWVISNDTSIISGYLCQKAICDFRGRKYIAWFTMGIPISNGPWKFGGLPGLILKVYDDNHLYTFECVKIEVFKYPIEKRNYSAYNIISRQKLLKYQKELNTNFKKISGVVSIGKEEPKECSYEPLELE